MSEFTTFFWIESHKCHCKLRTLVISFFFLFFLSLKKSLLWKLKIVWTSVELKHSFNIKYKLSTAINIRKEVWIIKGKVCALLIYDSITEPFLFFLKKNKNKKIKKLWVSSYFSLLLMIINKKRKSIIVSLILRNEEY